jgi:phage terminase large subunit GpA-like protein
LNGLESQTVPQEATVLTGFIDVHDDLLYYAVVGWADDMTGFVVDYGTYPKQRRRMFAKWDKDLITMQRETNAARVNAAIQIGLTTLIKDLLATDYTVDGDGTATIQFNKILVDSGYVPNVVETAIRLVRSPVVEPSKGAGITAKNKEMAGWQHKPGRKFGNYWIEDKPAGRSMRTVTYDANQWKCAAHAGFAAGAGSRGGLTLWGHNTETHRMFSEHCNGEISKLVESGGNKVNEWQPKPGQDNHLFDCLVGNLVAASVCGVRSAEEQMLVKKRRKMV